jgi:ABC-type dipeptide transport system, periplasmic component
MRWSAFLLGALLLFTAGCGGGDSKNSKSSGEETFVYAIVADARVLDPQMSTDASSSNAVARRVYETLIVLDKDNNIVPALATEWKQVDPLTWEFTLRTDVKFHDGTDFDANAVKASLDRLLDPEAKRNRRSILRPIKEVNVLSADKIQIVTEAPFAPLLLHLTHACASIMSPKAIEEDAAGTSELATNPVGTGPFKFESWTKGDNITYSRFDEYWGEKAKVAKLVVKIVPEDSTRIAMVKTGEAQAADQVPLTDIERINKDDAMKLVRTSMYRTEFIAFNTEKAPFNDPKVRLAIAEAIDFKALISGVYQNVGTQEVSFMGPAVFGHNPNLVPYSFDVENAKKLLAEAGYPEGFKATLYVPDRKIRITLAEVIQAQLRPLGIDIQIITLEQGTYFNETEAGKHDICIDGWSNQTGDADFSLTPTLTPGGIASGQNIARYDNPQVTALLDQARVEIDPEKRKVLYYEAQEIIRNDAPILVTQATEQIDVVGKNVNGFWVTPGGVVVLGEVSID